MRLRNAFALLAFASLTGTGELRAFTSTFTTVTAGTPAGADFTFENSVNWTNGVPGVAGADATTAPATLTNTDTAQFYNNTAAGAGPITLAVTRNLLNLTFFSSGTSYTVGTTGGPAFYLSDGGTVTQMGNLVTLAAPTVLVGSATFNANSSASRVLTVSGAVNGSGVSGATLTLTSPYAGNNTISGKIGGSTTATQTLSVLKIGVGNWVLTNTANTYSGGTTITAGTIFSSAGTGGTSISTNVIGSGTLTLNGGTLGLTFNGAANTFNNPLTVNASTTSTMILRTTSVDAVFAAQSVGGTGTLILSSNAGATGTTIDAGFGRVAGGATASTTGAFGTFAGTLQISPNNTTNGTTTLNITNAAALAGTAGTVSITTGGIITSTAVANINSGSAVTVSGGTLTPNGTAVGMLTLTGNKTFSMTTGTLGLTLTSTAAGGFDQIVGSGTSTFSLTGGTLDLGGVTAAAGNSYQVFSGFAAGNTVSGITYTDFAAGDGSQPSLSNTGLLTFAAVPEPGAFAQMGCLALVGLAFAGVRRRMAVR